MRGIVYDKLIGHSECVFEPMISLDSIVLDKQCVYGLDFT